jgi:hypothetical protein
VSGGPIFVPFCAWTFGERKPGPQAPPVRIACAQGNWRLRRIRLLRRQELPLAAWLVVRDLVCGAERPIWHTHSGVTVADAAVRLADLDRMRFDQPMRIGTACDLALDLMPNYESGAGAHRLEMVATFVPGLRCLTCGGRGEQTIGGEGLLGLQSPSFSHQCPTCEGSGQR